MVKQLSFILLLFVLISHSSTAQVVINEFLSSNTLGINDEDNEKSDWIELYNSSDQPVNIVGYKISDSRNSSDGWIFPDVTIPSDSFLVLFASGKDKDGISPKFHTIIREGDIWKYLVTSNYSFANWRNPDYDDSWWSSGPSGFGYGDEDDATVLNNAYVVLIRKKFTIDDVSKITSMLLHVDYDDGFVAFINGVEVAMGGIAEFNDDYSKVTASGHEATMFSGGVPNQFDISASIKLLKNGKNVIAIQGHNAGTSSTDFSLIPFLTISSSQYTSNDAEDFIPVEDGNLHTNFKLSKAGEPIFLYDARAVLIDSSKAVVLDDNFSFGRYPDGDDKWSYFKQPTPGRINANPSEAIVHDSVLFSMKGGFYNSPFYLTLIPTSTTGGTIRYSTDGSEPTDLSSVYVSPLFIATTLVVRAAYFGTDGARNPVTTGTFIFDDANGLPVISISTAPDNLYDWNEGILVKGPNAELSNPYYGANFWQDWEKPIHFEFFDREKTLQIDQDAGIKVAGNWSRANEQKSLALYARKSYGKGSFDYKFFNDKSNDSFESILLRNSGNDWSYTMFRDGLVSEIARDMDMERLAYQPAKIYLNGKYWGILNLREKPSEPYFKGNFGVKEDNLNLLENSGDVIYGNNKDYRDLRTFLNTKPLSIDENYLQVCDMMDIQCFIDYQILEIYIDNGDWPGNNIKFWKSTDRLGKWRWLIFDSDFGFNLYHTNGNTIEFATATNGPSWPNPPWSTLFLRKLLTNQEFKYNFINRFSDCLNSNLLYDELDFKVDSIQNLLTPEIENHLESWGFSYENWITEVNRIRAFLASRRFDMRSYIRSYFGFNTDHLITLTLSDQQAGRIKINTIVPDKYPFQGFYFAEVPITLKAIPNPGYRFVCWKDGSTSTDKSITVNLTSNNYYTAVFEPATSDEELIVINEINYKSSDDFDSGDWIELFNNGSNTIDLSGWVLKDDDQASGFVFPQGFLLYPDEYIVIAEDLSKFAHTFPFVKNVVGEFSFGLSSSGDMIYLYDAKGAFVDKVEYGVQSPWPVSPSGQGPTLELLQPDLDNEEATSWSSGKIGGTPGRKNTFSVSAETIPVSSAKASCFPTTFSDYTTLQFFAEKGGKYSVQVIDLQGRLYDKITGSTNQGEEVTLDLFTTSGRFSAGIYLVKVQTEERVQTIKVVKR